MQDKRKVYAKLKIYVNWHLIYVDSLLGNDRETNNETMAVDRQGPARNSGSTVGSGVFYVVRSEAILRDLPSSVRRHAVA
jgi:hypothetical protein